MKFTEKEIAEYNFDIAEFDLNNLCAKALDGNKNTQEFLERQVFFGKWKTIKKKLAVEGSTHYVWWVDAVHNFMKIQLKRISEEKKAKLKDISKLACEIFEAAQLLPNEGRYDGTKRVMEILKREEK